MYARTCHETALSHGVRSTSATTHAALDMVGEVADTTRKDIRIGISASALVCRSLQAMPDSSHRGCICIGGPAHRLAIHTPGWLQMSGTPQRVTLWSAAVRSACTTAQTAVVHPIMSLRSSHLVGDH